MSTTTTSVVLAFALAIASPAVAKAPKAQNKRPVLIKPQLQLQTWITPWDQDQDPQADPAGYGDPEHDPGFLIKRFRTGFKGRFNRLDYSLLIGTSARYDVWEEASSGINIVDAYGRYTAETPIGPLGFTLGLQRVPFSREMLMSSKVLVFQERSVGTNWLNPLRDVGVVGGQTWVLPGESGSQLTLRAGVFNGNGDEFGDIDPGVLVVGRLEYTMGDTYRTWSTSGENAVGVAVSGMMNTEMATTTQAANVDGMGRVGPVTLLFEGTFSTIKPT
ncbi:MAG: hypothetical protein HN348_32955, partial [Proteobacteria bacterium]|nr:hypothetical protein [Pseudomonadota bacterium]